MAEQGLVIRCLDSGEVMWVVSKRRALSDAKMSCIDWCPWSTCGMFWGKDIFNWYDIYTTRNDRDSLWYLSAGGVTQQLVQRGTCPGSIHSLHGDFLCCLPLCN